MNERVEKLLRDRYYVGEEDSWASLSDRVSGYIAETEEQDNKFYEMLENLEFVPNSPILMNADTDLGYLSACNVLPVDDTIEGIFNAKTISAIVNKVGGGTGFAFSRLRPTGDKVGSTGGVSSGVVSFMKSFDEDINTIKQGGRRRGAMMGVLRVDHPDIMDFITAKGELDEDNKEIFEYTMKFAEIGEKGKERIKQRLLDTQLSNFNISIAITDKFMKALEEDKEFELINPRDGEVWDTINPQKIWDKIINYAHKNGEPGLIFLDKINRTHPINEKIESVNVCGEQPLLPYESCILGAINLAKVHDEKYDDIDYIKLEELVRNAVEFLDLAIDKNKYPFEELKESAQKYRKIGVGVMGWAELLIRLNMRYGSQESLDLAEEMSNFINQTAIEKSEELAEEKGVFPGFDNTTIETPRRNAVLTTVAPTGSRSFIANTSGGIEPFYNIEGYTHTDADGEETEFMFDFMENASDYALVGSLDINPLDHVYMQSAWQKNIGSAVSKTVNLPNNATVEDVDKIYRTAHRTKCKGITIYRDGSKTSQVLNSSEDGEEEIQEVEEINVKTSPAKAHSKRYKLKTGCGTLYFIPVFDDAGNLIEVFNSTSNGGCGSFTEATSRMISLALRAGVSLEEIIDQLQSINPCPSYMYSKGKGQDVDLGSSCPSAIANKLRQYVDDSEDILETKVEEKKKEKEILDDKNICPECGEGKLQMESGCVSCSICGWSKCG